MALRPNDGRATALEYCFRLSGASDVHDCNDSIMPVFGDMGDEYPAVTCPLDHPGHPIASADLSGIQTVYIPGVPLRTGSYCLGTHPTDDQYFVFEPRHWTDNISGDQLYNRNTIFLRIIRRIDQPLPEDERCCVSIRFTPYNTDGNYYAFLIRPSIRERNDIAVERNTMYVMWAIGSWYKCTFNNDGHFVSMEGFREPGMVISME